MRVFYLCDYAIFLYNRIIRMFMVTINGCGVACGQLHNS